MVRRNLDNAIGSPAALILHDSWFHIHAGVLAGAIAQRDAEPDRAPDDPRRLGATRHFSECGTAASWLDEALLSAGYFH
jgi:hypothetical protein